MKYLSVCSGIEAASVAWEPLGWEPVAFSEIEPFPAAVLAHHWPSVPNLGDMTRWREWEEQTLARADILVGGTPCQAFSVAGLRQSLADERGNLTLTYVHLLDAIDQARACHGRPPAVCLWENVPGVLNTDDNAFGCLLAALAGEHVPLEPPGGRWTDAGYVRGPRRAIVWRCLDAQFVGLAQRRKRVFLVAGAGDGFRPEQVLFESEGVRRDSPPRREAGERVAATLERSVGSRGYKDNGDPRPNLIPQVVGALPSGGSPKGHGTAGINNQAAAAGHVIPVAYAATDYKDGKFEEVDHARALTTSADRTRSAPVVAFSCKDHGADAGDLAPTLRSMNHNASHANGGGQVAVAFNLFGGGKRKDRPEGGFYAEQAKTSKALDATGGLNPTAAQGGTAVAVPCAVRRLTPVECARLQGFSDAHTAIPWRGKPAKDCPDGPQYKAYGNSMAVPCMPWTRPPIAATLPRAPLPTPTEA